jgi:hypothetical protein
MKVWILILFQLTMFFRLHLSFFTGKETEQIIERCIILKSKVFESSWCFYLWLFRSLRNLMRVIPFYCRGTQSLVLQWTLASLTQL